MAVSGNVKKGSNKKGIKGFFRGVKGEFNRITWASKKDTQKATIAVFSFCIFFLIFVGLLDKGFQQIFGLIFK